MCVCTRTHTHATGWGKSKQAQGDRSHGPPEQGAEDRLEAKEAPIKGLHGTKCQSLRNMRASKGGRTTWHEEKSLVWGVKVRAR